jgi:transposase-like protein
VRALLQGPAEGQSGEALLSLLVRLSTERIWPEALEQEQAVAVGRGRYDARGEKRGDRNGYENGTLKTGEGILHVQGPQSRGQANS